jgi:16S rRNA processing protein RimM
MAQAMPLPGKRLCVGVVAGPHGVGGAVRVKSFTADPADIGAYGPVCDEAGLRRFGIRVLGLQKGVVLAKLEGVATREAAEALKGLRLHVERDRLPPPEAEEFYHADLVGLTAALADGAAFGRIAAIWDFGAGTSLEIERPGGGAVMVPFTRAAVPVVDLAAGRVVVDPPAGLLERPEPPERLTAQEQLAAERLGGDRP